MPATFNIEQRCRVKGDSEHSDILKSPGLTSEPFVSEMLLNTKIIGDISSEMRILHQITQLIASDWIAGLFWASTEETDI